MKKTNKNVIVMGGGHNGLVAATCLAQAGLRVTLCEAGERFGGMAAPLEIHPGFKASLAHLLPTFDQRVMRALKLPRESAKPAGIGLTTMALQPEGGALEIGPDPQRMAERLRPFSTRDAAAYGDFWQRLQGHASTLQRLFETTPPRLNLADKKEWLTLGRLGWHIRRQGRAEMRELLRIGTMAVADLLDENLETECLRGVFALDAVLGTDHGPRSPNTVFTLLHRLAKRHPGRHAHRYGAPFASAGATIEALVAAAKAAGVTLQSGMEVARVRVDSDSCCGVELADGRVLEADIVVSGVDPAITLTELVGGDHLDADLLADMCAVRSRGSTGQVSFALERLPDLPRPPASGATRWLWAPSVDYLEEAFDHVKYGQPVPEPALEVTLPSLHDPRCAPEGQHVMSVNVAYAPHHMTAEGQNLGDTVRRQIERRIPGFSDSVLAIQAWGPQEIESFFGTRGGHWHHGDIALDQFFMMRPAPGVAQYRTPIDGLYLCGAGTHPGGGLTGTSGFNAAREILRDRKHGRNAA